MDDASALEKVENLLRAAANRGLGLLEYAEGPFHLRLSFAEGERPADSAHERPGGRLVQVATPADAAFILSPGVGFLRCSHPAGDQFPGEDAEIAAGTVVALIQAGPLLQPVTASRGGRLGKRLADDGAGVGFGTALFELL